MSWLVDLFRVLSSCGSVFMILSLVPTMLGIHRARATGHMPITPLASMLVNCHLWMLYGYLDRNYVPLAVSFTFGDVVSLVYLAVYYRYTTERAYVHKILAACSVVVVLTTAYAMLGELELTGQSHSAVTATMGYIGIAAAVLFYGSPFEKIALVFQTRCGVFIPITMVTVGAVNSMVWVVYSLLANDWFLFGPNLFTLAMGLAQIAVYVAFHPASHPLPVEYEFEKDLEQGKDTTATTTSAYVSIQSPLEPRQ